MAPVATSTTYPEPQQAKPQREVLINPFYSPFAESKVEEDYEFSQYTPVFPAVSWEPLGPIEVNDRGHHADPEKKALLSAATKIIHLTPSIGTELHGIDLRQLSSQQKDELALLIAERGVVFFRDQAINIHEQLELGRHFGPLHKHATTPVPKEPGLQEVHVVYTDGTKRPDSSAYTRSDLWHSDVTYEVQPPSTTSLKLYTAPDVGGDTHWTSGYAVYSSLSPFFQKYLEGLTAIHSAVAQAEGARAAGTHVRRQEIETIHPIVRVHPVTGWKSVYVNPGFTRRIIGIPKAESDAVLAFLFRQITENLDFQVRFRWEKNSVAIWDNRVTTHAATFDFFPQKRHALRVTPHGEKPLSVEEYEAQYGKSAKDRQLEIWKQQGVDVASLATPAVNKRNGVEVKKGYND
ncbi:TauD-domain-containing protein [Sistotremastrum suecicum HHB10207 ss-3]|uniref:TauD-domain-containing protein n=1 Tax=Sistotremastrum suecicum HHB10207 ss-3 TaxID=1314776 RepID=A0A166AXT6_9AGAM|nr:TauD-domain-containing protein [Sistotremastrum suecicum HHB10207 ss-3]